MDEERISNFFLALLLLLAMLLFIGLCVLAIWGIVAMITNGILPVLMGDGA